MGDANFEPIKKDFYAEHSVVSQRSEEANSKYMADKCITATGHKVPRPVTSFDESSLPKYLVDQLKALDKFVEPSPIQAQSWPVALQGRDLIGIA